jgi:chorismate-pyruvate lyase
MLTLETLYALFPGDRFRVGVEPVDAADVPEPYRALLVHTLHMTVTVEAHFNDAVDVEVHEVAQSGHEYARKIALRLRSGRRVVQFGMVAVALDRLDPAVAAEIVAGKTPLGRVLIEHDVLRDIRPVQFFRAALPADLAEVMGVPAGSVTYGRLGVITADGHPAVRVAEILAPI